MKIRPVGAQRTDRRSDTHDEANGNFAQFCVRT